MAIDYSDEDFDQDLQQDIAAAAAQSAGVNMDSYDFGGFDSGGSDFTGASNQGVIDSIVGSYMDNPSRTGMAIRQSAPNFRTPRSGLNQFANLYTSRRGPMSRSDFNSLYDITRDNPYGIETLGYDTAKTLQRYGIGSGQVKTNPNAGMLTGTVFKDGVITKDGKNQGVAADVYYGDRKDTADDYAGRPRYTDKGYLGAGGVPYANPAERALNRAYDQYLNPLNTPGEPGYNPDIDPNVNREAFDIRGQVRPGLQSGIFGRKDGTPTVLGPIATYDRNYSGTDNIAMGVTGGMGMLTRALTNRVTGIAGQPLPQDAMAPTPEMIARGETYGGLGRSLRQIPGQAVQGFKDAGSALQNVIDDFTTPNVSEPAPVNTVPQTRESIIDELYSRNFYNARQKAINEADTRRASEEVLRQAVGDFRTAGGLSEEAALAARVNPETIADVFETYQPTPGGTSSRPAVTNPYSTFTGPLRGAEYANEEARKADVERAFQTSFNAPTAGEKLAGLDTLGAAIGRGSVKLDSSTQDFLDEHGMSIKDLMDKDFSKVPNGAVLPSGEIMSDELRPEKSSFVPAPDIMQQIRNATAARELGGPLTANQLAGTLEYVLPGKGYKGSRTYFPGGNSTPVFGNERFSGEGIMNTIKDLMVPDFIEDYFNQRGMRQRRTG